MKRREALKAFVGQTLLLVAAALPYGFSRLLSPAFSRPATNYLRPPGALADDAAFVAACIGCGLCGEVCPVRCIRFHDRDGGAAAATPYINPVKKACILCDKCIDVCPTEALTPLARVDIDMGIAEIDRTACYPWIDKGICGACVSICPLGKKAISYKMWNQYRPIVHNACVGCGLCVEVCPHPQKALWIKQRGPESPAEHA